MSAKTPAAFDALASKAFDAIPPRRRLQMEREAAAKAKRAGKRSA